MAWSISHSQEAWDNVRENLAEWTPERLVAAICDDRFEEVQERGASLENCEAAANALRAKIAGLTVDVLVNTAIERIEMHRTCSNGGFEFYVDRHGYYTVSCDREKVEE